MQPHPRRATPPWPAASPAAPGSAQARRRVRLSARWGLALGLLVCLVARGAQPYQPVRSDPLMEPWRWRTFPELSGLDAQCMAEGPDGTIWFGTADGLTGYNGIEWIRHLSDNGALAGWVAGLCFEHDGSLIAGGWWGISHYRDGKWTRLIPDVGVRFADVRDLVITPDGSVWAATSWGALRRRESVWTLFTDSATAARLRTDPHYQALRVEILPEAMLAKPRRAGSPASRIDLLEVSVDSHGRIWFGTKGGEILRHDSLAPAGAWHLYNETDGLASGRVTSILPRADGTVWAAQGLATGVSVFDGTAWHAKPLPAPGLAADGGRLLQTRDGVVWLSAKYVVYACDPGGTWRKYEPPGVPLPHATNLLLQSRDGALWFAGPNTDIQRIDYQTPRWLTLQDLNFQWETPAGEQWSSTATAASSPRKADAGPATAPRTG